MKIKNFILMVLVVLMVMFLMVPALLATDFTLSFTHDSRYIFEGVDFAAKNDAPLNLVGISVSEKKFGAFVYSAVSEDYFEWGTSMSYTFNIKGVELKSTLFPFGWVACDKFDWGVMTIEEMFISNPIFPIFAKWLYAYIPEKKELNGHYFYMGTTKDFFGFQLQAGVNYNKHLFTGGGEDWGGILGISRSIELTEKSSLDFYFRYYINAGKVNEDEQVVGATISIKL